MTDTFSSTNLIKTALSSGGVYLFDQRYDSKDPNVMTRVGYQALPSLLAENLKMLFHRLWPLWNMEQIFIKPLLVGVSFTILCSVFDTKERTMVWVRYNMLESFLSELAATALTNPKTMLNLGLVTGSQTAIQASPVTQLQPTYDRVSSTW